MTEINDNTIKFIKVIIGNFAVCDLNKFKKIIKQSGTKNITVNNVFILKIKQPFLIQFPECTEPQQVWFCKLLKKESETENYFFKTVYTIYARCKNSMKILDRINRDYICNHMTLPTGSDKIIAIKSVAGSGKTTTLLNLAKRFKDKKILYLAFNKSLIEEIKNKLNDNGIKNMSPQTFDALMRDVYINSTDEFPNLIDLKHTTIGDYEPFFKGKSFQLRKAYVNYYQKFCNQVEFSDPKKFSQRKLGGEKRLLISMWKDTVNKKYQTFDSIRKLAQINRWARGYIDNIFDMVFIDEAQDFDPLMLHILLNDVKLPKIFVGDPMQAIYEWRGCINSFDNLPETAQIIEFYSTFRLGEPACTIVRKSFENCWMISKSLNKTNIVPNKDFKDTESFVYLFRTWKSLLQTAAKINTKVWIYNFESQMEFIKKLHQKLQYADLSKEERNNFSDDLPAFLIKLSFEQLDELLSNVKSNYTNEKSKAKCMMYTIHSFKGLEHDRIKIHDDIQPDEHNLRYVALTRGKLEIAIAID
jgi:hypothetical protein